ncbi:MAG: thioredoxin family protein [Chitinophagaceae bacterium]|nr:thioredoxin family protein [Chitinophagaceae bacterium]
MKQILFSFIMLMSVVFAKAQPTPASASDILKEAYQQAAKENKNVFVMFHASWCCWCHKMDKSMNDPACKKFFDDNYIIRHLVVDEAKDKKNLENPGAAEMKIKYNGDGQGIPFWLVFDKQGNLLSDSKIRKEGDGPEKGDNAGCPANENEVNFFIDVLKKTSSINKGQSDIIRKRFRENDQ